MATLKNWNHKHLLGLTVEAETLFDHPTVDGLKFRAYPNGRKSWHWLRVVSGKRYKAALGRFPDMTMVDAESIVREHNAKLAGGENPLVKAVVKARVTIREAWALYVEACDLRRRRATGQRNAEAEHTFLPVLGDMFVSDVKPVDIRHCVTRYLEDCATRSHKNASTGGTASANRMLAVLTTLFNFCIKNEIDDCGRNPAKAVDDVEVTGSRPARVMSLRELALVILAARAYDQERGGATTWADIMTVIIMNGNRHGEVLYAVGEEWNPKEGQWVIPASRYKTKVDCILCVGPTTAEIFNRRAKKGEFIFPKQPCVRAGAHRRVIDRLTVLMEEIGGEPVEHWWSHALRYGFRSQIRKHKVCDSETAEKIIHPRNPKNKMSSRYDPDFTEETTEALAKWDALVNAEISAIVAERMSAVA